MNAQDHILNEYSNPPLTSFSVPSREIGHAAAEMLLKRIEEPNRAPRELRILGHLVERESVGPPPVL